MDNILIFAILLIVLLILFLIIFLHVSKLKIKEIIVPLDISCDEINGLLKQKYKLYKEIILYIKNNLSIKEEAFKDFLEFKAQECRQSELISILDETTYEINEYIDNYDELLKQEEFKELKRKLYKIQLSLEATIDFYNNNIILYNDLKTNGPTSLASKFFQFDEYENISNEKKEISRLINLS